PPAPRRRGHRRPAMNLFEPFTIPYMQRALAEVLVLGALAGAGGVLVVLRRRAFVGDALTHTVFPGVVIAHLLGRSLLAGALAFGVLTAVLLPPLRHPPRAGHPPHLVLLPRGGADLPDPGLHRRPDRVPVRPGAGHRPDRPGPDPG